MVCVLKIQIYFEDSKVAIAAGGKCINSQLCFFHTVNEYEGAPTILHFQIPKQSTTRLSLKLLQDEGKTPLLQRNNRLHDLI